MALLNHEMAYKWCLDGKDWRFDYMNEVYIKVLDELKQTKFKIKGWRQSQKLCAQVKMIILDHFWLLLPVSFTNEQVYQEADKFYKYIYESDY